jgi:hypothetical protein
METKSTNVLSIRRATQAVAATATALLLLVQPLQAQMPASGMDIRIGVQTAEPTNGLGNGYDNGFGLYTRIGAPVGVGRLSLMGAATWTRFEPKSSLIDDLDIITLQFGPHLMMIPGLDVGLEAAYITDADKVGLVPVISFGIPNLEGTLSYTSTLSGPQYSWFALGIGFKF